jgi:hypothetical protein
MVDCAAVRCLVQIFQRLTFMYHLIAPKRVDATCPNAFVAMVKNQLHLDSQFLSES